MKMEVSNYLQRSHIENDIRKNPSDKWLQSRYAVLLPIGGFIIGQVVSSFFIKRVVSPVSSTYISMAIGIIVAIAVLVFAAHHDVKILRKEEEFILNSLGKNERFIGRSEFDLLSKSGYLSKDLIKNYRVIDDIRLEEFRVNNMRILNNLLEKIIYHHRSSQDQLIESFNKMKNNGYLIMKDPRDPEKKKYYNLYDKPNLVINLNYYEYTKTRQEMKEKLTATIQQFLESKLGMENVDAILSFADSNELKIRCEQFISSKLCT